MKTCDHENHLGERCTNEARYVNNSGHWLCGIHDMSAPWISIRLSDLPMLLDQLDLIFTGSPSLRGYALAKEHAEDKIKELLCLRRHR